MVRILYRFIVGLARLAVRSGRSKDLEIIVLRHQLNALRRQTVRPTLHDDDRTLLGGIAAAPPVGCGPVGSSHQTPCFAGTDEPPTPPLPRSATTNRDRDTASRGPTPPSSGEIDSLHGLINEYRNAA